jgi:hypothetical protein
VGPGRAGPRVLVVVSGRKHTHRKEWHQPLNDECSRSEHILGHSCRFLLHSGHLRDARMSAEVLTQRMLPYKAFAYPPPCLESDLGQNRVTRAISLCTSETTYQPVRDCERGRAPSDAC